MVDHHLIFIYFINSYYDFFETKASTQTIYKVNLKHLVFTSHKTNVQKHLEYILKRNFCDLNRKGKT